MTTIGVIDSGLALAQPKRLVLVITGDGEMPMGLGSLATVAVQAPKNLAVVVLDNERYGETVQQLTYTGLGTDLAGIAAASGFASAVMVKGGAELGNFAAAMWKGRGPMFAQIKVDPEKLPIVLPPREVSYLKNRMRISTLGEACLQQ